MNKSANQLYKESGSSLSFKDWIQREKDKGIFIKNDLLNDVVKDEKTPSLASPFIAKFDSGIPKWVVATGAVIVVGAFIYNYYRK